MKPLYASLFHGIEGFGLGLTRAGFQGAWGAEIDAGCRSVVRRHFPEFQSFEDVRHANAGNAIRPRLLCAGWPCQGNSVAGKRAGMADERSGLWSEVKRCLAEFTPDWFLGENVPGILSVNGGRDWLAVLRDLAELGYGFAYRILDSQWFGVPQRRRRVFIVGCLGDWRRAAEVLFESDCLPWHPAPRREARTRIAPSLARGSGVSSNAPGRRREDDYNIVNCLDRHMGGGGVDDNAAQAGHIIAGPLASHSKEHGHAMTTQQAVEAGHIIADTLRAKRPGEGGIAGDDTHLVANTLMAHEGIHDHLGQNYVAHTLRGEGFDASEDGTGRGTPIVVSPLKASNHYADQVGLESQLVPVAFQCHGSNVGPMGTLRKGNGDLTGGVPFILGGDSRPTAADGPRANQCLNAGATPAVAFQTRIARNGRGQPKDIADALTSCEGGTHADTKPHVAYSGGVRRLTPRECERLQGFPDDWTRWDANGKEISDSARYRMLGNAVTVNVIERLGQRLMSRLTD